MTENEMVREAQTGNRSAVDALVTKYSDMAHSIAHSFKGAKHDDKFQAAMVGLLEAIQTFDPAGGAAFGTHARWGMMGAITVECRIARKAVNDMPAVDSEGEETTVTENAAGRELPPDIVAIRRETAERNTVTLRNALDAIAELPERDAEIVALYIGTDCGYQRSYAEVGAMVGLTRQRVAQIVQRGLEQIRAA